MPNTVPGSCADPSYLIVSFFAVPGPGRVAEGCPPIFGGVDALPGMMTCATLE